MERTLVLVKPDAVRRQLTGQIIGRLEAKGLRIAGIKMLRMSEQMARLHYAEHLGKPFFPNLLAFITSGPLVALAVEGPRAVAAVRQLVGSTDPLQSPPGTIRADLGLEQGSNLVHASDCPAAAERELSLFFQACECFPQAE